MNSDNSQHSAESGRERRKYPRVSGSVIEYSYVGVDQYRITAFVKDISVGGVCIYVHENIEANTPLQLYIHLFGSEKPMETNGRVVWKRNSQFLKCYDLGIQFEEISSTDRARLERYIQSVDTGPKEYDLAASMEKEIPAAVKVPVEPFVPVAQAEPAVVPDGKYKEYYESGELLSESTVKNGEIDGIKKYYYPTGELLEELNFAYGERNGLRKCFLKSGKVYLEQYFANGKSVGIRKFNKAGDVIYEKQS